MIAFQYRFNIESCASTQYREHMATLDVLIGIIEILLILKEIVLGSWLADVYQMIGNHFVCHGIVCQILASTNVHTTIHLTAIGTDNLSPHSCPTPRRRIHRINLGSKGSGKTCFSTSRRSQYGYHRMFHSAKIRQNKERTK